MAFTLAPLTWRPWLPPVPLAACGEAQLAALVESGPEARRNAYYLTLAHDASALTARSRLFNTIMYAPRGLPRADRELAAAAESRMNGCVFCASVHGRLHVRLSKDSETMARLLEHGPSAAMSPRNRVIVNYAIRLGVGRPAADDSDILALRAVGLTDPEIIDLTHAIAIFAWANRLMLSLGEAEAAPADFNDADGDYLLQRAMG